MLFNIVAILIFLLLVTVLVAAHEFGHYLFARIFKMEVEEFAIGFGPKPILIWMRRKQVVPSEPTSLPAKPGDASIVPAQDQIPVRISETLFTVRPIPLGGFVRIKGMIPLDDGSEIRIPGGFYSRPAWQRFLVLFAGPVFSILAGWAVLIPLFSTVGVLKPVEEPVIVDVTKNSAAEAAGLKKGDRVLAVDGAPVKTFYELRTKIQDKPNIPVSLTIDRKGERLTVVAIPKAESGPVIGPDLKASKEVKLQGKLGIPPVVLVRQPFTESVRLALLRPVEMVQGVAGLFSKRASEIKEQVGGPIAIFKATKETAESGMAPLLDFAANLSIFLGIFNLFPVPPLDGGQMLVALVEILRGGRRLSMRVQTWVHSVGFVLIGLLMISVFAIDIERLIR